MHVLVTGGRGMTGRWVVDRLADAHTVTCLDRELPRTPLPAPVTSGRTSTSGTSSTWWKRR